MEVGPKWRKMGLERLPTAVKGLFCNSPGHRKQARRSCSVRRSYLADLRGQSVILWPTNG